MCAELDLLSAVMHIDIVNYLIHKKSADTREMLRSFKVLQPKLQWLVKDAMALKL